VCCFFHISVLLSLQTKGVQQAMDQKDFHRAVEFRGRLVVSCVA